MGVRGEEEKWRRMREKKNWGERGGRALGRERARGK